MACVSPSIIGEAPWVCQSTLNGTLVGQLSAVDKVECQVSIFHGKVPENTTGAEGWMSLAKLPYFPIVK